jgi:hypothetical protein
LRYTIGITAAGTVAGVRSFSATTVGRSLRATPVLLMRGITANMED